MGMKFDIPLHYSHGGMKVKSQVSYLCFGFSTSCYYIQMCVWCVMGGVNVNFGGLTKADVRCCDGLKVPSLLAAPYVCHLTPFLSRVNTMKDGHPQHIQCDCIPHSLQCPWMIPPSSFPLLSHG